MKSNYGVLPSPQVISDGKYRCPKCGKVFKNLDSYNLHRHESKVKDAVDRVDEPLM
jgi:transposase-like protein